MIGTISNAARDLIVSSLCDQTQMLQDLISQLEDRSIIDEGPGWSCEDIAAVERALKRIRKIIQKHESKNELPRINFLW